MKYASVSIFSQPSGLHDHAHAGHSPAWRISLLRLPIDLMPEITYPTLAVFTSYSNASPSEIEQLITRPIEEAMSAVAGVEEVTSTSMEGESTVRLSFSWGPDLDAPANDIRGCLDRVIGRLPDDAELPMLGKFDPAAFPIPILGAFGNLDLLEMRRIIGDRVKYRIERVPGAVVGGLSDSTLIPLIFIPVIYSIVEKK